MKRNFSVLIIICILVSLLMGCNQKVTIKEGMTRDQVIEKFGKPTGELSGLDGEVFLVDGKEIVVYYKTNENENKVVSHIGNFGEE